jgi:hypothetical protein
MAHLLARSDVRYDVGDEHRFSGRPMPAITLESGRRVVELLHEARPLLRRCSFGLTAMSHGPLTNRAMPMSSGCAPRSPDGSVTRPPIADRQSTCLADSGLICGSAA